jgi:hypothetical protein
MSDVHYLEHAPPPDLADRVECVWTLRSEGRLPAAVLNRVVPDGYADVIFDPGGPPRVVGAHMIREFRGFAGLTPEAFRRERARVASVRYAGAAGA